jgi:signal transduction histidine kinase
MIPRLPRLCAPRFWRHTDPDRQPGAPADGPATSEAQLTDAERALLATLDAQRRLDLLRVIVPGLFAVALLALPFALVADVQSRSTQSTAQVGVALGGFAVALLAVSRRKVNIAALAFIAGLSGVLVMLLLNDGPMSGALTLSVMPEFALLAVPIVATGLFGGPRAVGLVSLASASFTVLLVLLTPHAADLRATLAAGNGAVVFTVPIAAQLAVGILTIAAARGNRRIQRELITTRVAYERERELDRLKDQFISSVNHELRTPIMALQGYLDLARELAARGDTAREDQMLARGQEAAGHLAGLVRSVLNVRNVEVDAAAMRPSPFALRPVVLAAVNLLDPHEAGDQPRDLRLRVPAEFAVYADEERVRQVLLNLLSNAAKYSPPGSPIEISASLRRPPAGRQSASTPNLAPTVEIAVRDHGAGIPPDQAPLLFARFVRLERDIASGINGTGLGLAICRAYIEAMGGRIWVESSGLPGEGSTFRFTLPLADTPFHADIPASDAAASPTAR